MIPVTCSNCGLQVLVPPAVRGRWGTCFACGAKLMVPQAAAAGNEDLLFPAGTRISDRYRIEERIGKGGMGVVYSAEDALMEENVALKFMFPRLLRTQRGQQLFIREAQIARRLRHDNVVAVHDVASTPEGIMYLSMELLEGQPLRAFLRKHRQDRRLVDVRLAVHIMAQVLDALDYAHRHVVHRDMKPENVMLLPGERVKVLDFGLAKAFDSAPIEGDQSGRMVGTAAYAAPEQKRRMELDGRSDVFAAGLILREILTLRTPIDDQIPVEKARQDVAPSLMEVLQRAELEDREMRWQTAGEFRRALLDAFDASYRRANSVTIHAGEGRAVSLEGMVYQEGGSFIMGEDSLPDASPEFESHVEPFYIDAYPVTRAQYAAFIEATGREEPKFWDSRELSGADQPVVGVTWDDAAAYAAWAGKRLPSEAEWEFAARGKADRRYPWGNQEPDAMRCNFGDYLNMPSIVTLHEDGATPEGVFDMAGNVFEWCADTFVPYRKGTQAGKGAADDPRRVVRGGCWNSPQRELRCSFRRGLFPESRLTTLGFRCVVSARTP